jgi:hypothetical protein
MRMKLAPPKPAGVAGSWWHVWPHLVNVVLRCPSCNHVGLSRDDPEDWDYVQLESPRHLLHGIVHENGFGHLVRINGREGGSSVMTGSQLINFWDRLCRYLRVR